MFQGKMVFLFFSNQINSNIHSIHFDPSTKKWITISFKVSFLMKLSNGNSTNFMLLIAPTLKIG